MITANQIKITSQITSAVIQINNAGIAYANMYLSGEHGDSLHITVLPFDRPSGDLKAQREVAMFDRYIDLSGPTVMQDLKDSLATLNAFLMDKEIAA